MTPSPEYGLETKFCRMADALTLADGQVVTGYASVFGEPDQSGDVVQPGAYAQSLADQAATGRRIKMLWQHNPLEPIGIWDEVREDARGLYVKGRLLTDVTRAREAATLVEAGAIDGLSIGYKTIRTTRDAQGHRLLNEVELWEVSLVTFPMLSEARVNAPMPGAVAAKAHDPDMWHHLTRSFEAARRKLAARVLR